MPATKTLIYHPGLPQVARAWRFAREEAPALLLVPRHRLALYRDLGALVQPVYVNPEPFALGARAHFVLDYETALRPVPKDPLAEGLVLKVGGRYPRAALLDQLERIGKSRDDAVRVLGEVVEVGSARLEFFGDELERIEVEGKVREEVVFEAPPGLAAETAPLITRFSGPIWVEEPVLLPEPLAELIRPRLVGAFAPLPGGEPAPLPVEPLSPYRAALKKAREDVERWLGEGRRVVLLYKHEKALEHLRTRHFADLPTRVAHKVEPFRGLLFVPGGFEGGFIEAGSGTVYLTEALLYGFAGASAVRRTFLKGEAVADPDLLAPGDYLIHPEHGIGRLEAITTREVLGVRRDYLVIKYRDEGRLYVPVEELPTLRRHPATSDEPPELSSLAKKDWKRTRARAQKSAEELAQRLLVLHAERAATPGRSFGPLPEWDPLIEAGFPHALTEDQKRALEAVLADLEADRPMDRLISGDVGFGKTEVALRAAHRVVGHGAQVAFLVPTTLLAEQHYRTFKERFKDLPVKVAMLSRFTSEREAKKVLKGLAEGTVDIVIGTHRLLEKGVRFKDLGLLIIDEEHRFGVAQKERLKEMKAGVDVLTLSATPIPRTLYQALVGLKDISSIQTPPPGRKPIRTVVAPFDPLLVREAVLNEIERGGKVFYVHNRVASIERRARWLAALVPEARIGVVHGQMPAAAIENVMLEFEAGAFDVLLATTIVESGLDVPLADTIIIERADALGLAQLYQLRGRVGRRQREAWAYLLHPEKLSETAEKRLAAIADLSDLGTGHLLAERDMEIRGVGNLLGPEQHGHIRAVSLEVYAEMVAEALQKLKGEEVKAPLHVGLDLRVSARIPPDYVADEKARTKLYAEVARAQGLAALSRILSRVKKTYGPLPPEARRFFALARLRLLAQRRGVRSIVEERDAVSVVLPAWPLDYDAKALSELPYAVEVVRHPPGFRLDARHLDEDEKLDALIRLMGVLA